MLLLCAAAAADPWLDADATRSAGRVREDGADTLLGASPVIGALPGWAWAWRLDPGVRLSLGDGVPDDLSGDEEPGPVGVVAIPEARVAYGPLVAWTASEFGYQDGLVARARGWAGLANGAYTLGFGKRDRWIGPGRHGALTRSDNAEPPWMGELALDGRLPRPLAFLGHFRADLGLGWLDAPRDDVSSPGLLAMNLRWAPIPQVELGLNRLSIFGGEGRPAADFGQLLVPSEPHVSDDPDKELADQNELASLDLRLTLPLRKWIGGPVRYVEGWWEYGGEDMIVREAAGLDYPALAGVANLYGAEVAVGPIVVTGEYARLMDDYFRWYVGHRVYHDGFTQDGRVLGHFGGPDSETIFGAVAWDDGRRRARLWADRVRRVGVIEAQQYRLFTFMEEDVRWRIGVDGSSPIASHLTLAGGYAFEHGEGVEFVPGAVRDTHRVWIGATWYTPAPPE